MSTRYRKKIGNSGTFLRLAYRKCIHFSGSAEAIFLEWQESIRKKCEVHYLHFTYYTTTDVSMPLNNTRRKNTFKQVDTFLSQKIDFIGELFVQNRCVQIRHNFSELHSSGPDGVNKTLKRSHRRECREL